MQARVFLQWLVFVSLTNQSLRVFANAEENTFTFFKNDSSFPGPTMSFKKYLNKGIFAFEFKTFVEKALMLYQDDEGFQNFVRLAIDDGRLQFSVATPWDEYPTKTRYNDFQWHSLKIEQNLTHFRLLVDGDLKAELATGPPDFKTDLLLGGFPNSRIASGNSITDQEARKLYRNRGFFFGCIRNITYGLNETTLAPVDDIPNLRSHVTKGSCKLSLCDKRRKNKPPGICENQGVCVPSETSLLPTCDCRWTGYNGSTCSEDALRLVLNGSYKVAYKPRTKVFMAGKQEQFTLRIKTARENAIILLAKDDKEKSDKLRLEIRNSTFMVTFQTGREDEDILRSSAIISDNNWHFVRYRRNERMSFLTVDKNTVNLASTKPVSNTSYDIFYIGDINNASMDFPIEVEDFIWEYEKTEINFVKEVYYSFSDWNNDYTVLPSGFIPMFNWKLPIGLRNNVTNISMVTASTVKDNCEKVGKECHSDAYCNNTTGSHECFCKAGFTGDGIHNCTDIDECIAIQSPCHDYAQCRNTNGSYICTCKPGFREDGYLNCTDVDECGESTTCFGECTNTIGSYNCRCLTGFTGDGKRNCTDINECAESENKCGEHAFCRNTEGSYSCTCKPGYIQNKYGNCSDINECVQDGSICHKQARCINTGGSFICQCRQKYHGDGVSACLPNNPCDTVLCFPGLMCTRTSNGSYSCEKCPPFFYGDGVNCVRNQSKSAVIEKSELVLKNEEWTDELANKSSEVYKTLATQLIEKIRKVYEKHPKFVYALIKKFRKGSVVAEFELIFTTHVEEPFKALQDAIDNGQLMNMTVGRREPLVTNTDSEKDEILGLNKTIFICIVALVSSVCILGVTVIIFILIIRRRRHGSAEIYQEKENLNSEPQELQTYESTAQEPNGQCSS